MIIASRILFHFGNNGKDLGTYSTGKGLSSQFFGRGWGEAKNTDGQRELLSNSNESL